MKKKQFLTFYDEFSIRFRFIFPPHVSAMSMMKNLANPTKYAHICKQKDYRP